MNFAPVNICTVCDPSVKDESQVQEFLILEHVHRPTASITPSVLADISNLEALTGIANLARPRSGAREDDSLMVS